MSSVVISGPFVLPTLAGGSRASANAVNSDGTVIVGHSDDATGNFQACIWNKSGGSFGTPTLIGHLSGNTGSSATGVSDDGLIVCGNSGSASFTRAFKWTLGGGLVEIGPVAGGSNTNVFAISKDGTKITGGSGVAATSRRLILYDVGTTLLTDLGLPSFGSGSANGSALSSDGSIIGGERGNTNVTRAFQWTALTSTFTDLGFPTGMNSAAVNAVSSDGLLFGGSAQLIPSSPLSIEAFLWTQAGGYDDGSAPGSLLANINPDAATLGISGDKKSIVGATPFIATVNNADTAWYSTSNYGGFTELGLPQLSFGGGSNTRALAISTDGLTIAGFSQVTGDPSAVYWIVNPVNAKVGEVFFDTPASFFDLSVPSNRALFHDGSGLPVDLGAMGASALVYLSRRGIPSTIAANLGTGGAFTINNGTVDDAGTIT